MLTVGINYLCIDVSNWLRGWPYESLTLVSIWTMDVLTHWQCYYTVYNNFIHFLCRRLSKISCGLLMAALTF